MNILKKVTISVVLLLLLALPFSFWNDWQNRRVVSALTLKSRAVSMDVQISELVPTVTSVTAKDDNVTTTIVESADTAQIISLVVSEPVVEESTTIPTVAATNTPLSAPTQTPTPLSTATPLYSGPPTLAIETIGRDGIVLLSGNATPNSTVTVLTNLWTVGVTQADEFGRWQQQIFFSKPATYEIFVREVDVDGMELTASDPISFQLSPEQLVENLLVIAPETLTSQLGLMQTDFSSPDTTSFQFNMERLSESLPSDTVLAISTSEDRCEGVERTGEILHYSKYRIGVCQTMTDVAGHAGVTLNLLLKVNTQLENPSLIHPGQIINLP